MHGKNKTNKLLDLSRFMKLVALISSAISITAAESAEENRAGPDWWSLQPLKSVNPPKVQDPDWGSNPVDAFVIRKLLSNGLKLSAQASPKTQVRRLYFDLIGLPPAPEVIREFENSPTDASYKKIVEGLLHSQHYGERWARHWLDIARFGESDGFERNNPRSNLWPFRDWVIESLNKDMPYDEFVRMQIAGDILMPGASGTAAVAFLAAGLHNTVVGGSEFMKKTARQDELEEITGAVGQTFLGLTVNCARCHDHKYDPISQKEYYQLTSALGGVFHGEKEVQDNEFAEELEKLEKEIVGIDQKISAIDTVARDNVLKARNKRPVKDRPASPEPIAKWEFDVNLQDSVGQMHGMAVGGARTENGALVLDGKGAFVKTSSLRQDITAKTLEAWVMLNNLDQRGGAAISLQTNNGIYFDAIVYGEKNPKAWMAGSNGFVRTLKSGGPAESTADKDPIHVAITYQEDGTITRYRNGSPYDQSYKTGIAKYAKGDAQILFGLRHGTEAEKKRMLAGKILRAQFYDRALDPGEIAASAGTGSDYVPEKELIASLSDNQRSERDKLKEQAKKLKEQANKYRSSKKTKIYSVAARSSPGITYVLNRGHALQPKEQVEPGAVKAVTGPNANFGIKADSSDAERRKKLANWVTHQDNPLFTRVIANRIWHHHFGAGLVKTPNDLGYNGGLPSHPELLDWLAGELKVNGYRLKHLHRIIVNSRTYRQSSKPDKQTLKKDADNRLLWRKSPTRIDAESLRDSMLLVSGKLNKEMGGPGFRDVTFRSLNGTTYYTPFDKEDPALNRRTVYRFSPRGQRSPILDAFDCPDPSTAAPKRSVTTTPLQALALLNNAFVLRMAEGFAANQKQENENDLTKQVDRIYEYAYGRGPDEEERRLGASLASEHGLAALCRVIFNSNEFVVIE